MALYEVKAWAVNWCGYENSFSIEARSEDEACEKAIYKLAEQYDLATDGNGNFVELKNDDSWDEYGEIREDAQVTTISSRIVV
jgi:hypothetical protein